MAGGRRRRTRTPWRSRERRSGGVTAGETPSGRPVLELARLLPPLSRNTVQGHGDGGGFRRRQGGATTRGKRGRGAGAWAAARGGSHHARGSGEPIREHRLALGRSTVRQVPAVGAAIFCCQPVCPRLPGGFQEYDRWDKPGA